MVSTNTVLLRNEIKIIFLESFDAQDADVDIYLSDLSINSSTESQTKVWIFIQYMGIDH